MAKPGRSEPVEAVEAVEGDELLPGQKPAPAKPAWIVPEYDPQVPHVIDGPLGRFGVMLPTAQEEVEIGVLTANQLNGLGPQQVDSRTYNMAYMLATLGVVTREPGYKPKDFSWSDRKKVTFRSFEVLLHYFEQYVEFRDSFRPRLADAD